MGEKKSIFTFSFPETLTFDLWTSNLLPIPVYGDVSTKLTVPTAFLFREIGCTGRTDRRIDRQTDRRTDGRGAVQHLMRPPWEGRITKSSL